MIDTNCVMCTIGGLLGVGAYAAANVSGGMDGPSYSADEVGGLLVRARLSSAGDYRGFSSLNEALSYMQSHMSGRFAFSYSGSPLGHMIAARREGGLIYFRDYQIGTEVSFMPPASQYFVWPVDM
jgi:hypothetical protein